MFSISDLISALEFFGITRETFFPPLIVGFITYLFINKAINKRIDELEERINARLTSIELRLDHIEGYLQDLSLNLVEMQTIMKMKLRDIRFEHKIKPYKKLEKARYTQV